MTESISTSFIKTHNLTLQAQKSSVSWNIFSCFNVSLNMPLSVSDSCLGLKRISLSLTVGDKTRSPGAEAEFAS